MIEDAGDRFWRKVDKSGDCWVWTAGRCRLGYGMFKLSGKDRGAHRVAYELAVGDIPVGIHVLHRCDNRCCVNPSHLFLGTHADNMRDMADKGRGVSVPWVARTICWDPTLRARGERAGRAKLTEADVLAIRQRGGLGHKHRDIASSFRVSKTLVTAILARKIWRHV